MKRASAFLMIGIAVVLVGVLTPEPARAYTLSSANYRWKTGTVCVLDRTEGRWPVPSATSRWSGVPDLTWSLGSACSQKVYVYAKHYGSTGWYGHTVPWLYTEKTSGDYEWLGDAWRTYRCTVRMNLSYSLSWSDKRSALMHEFGHCSGLDHTGSYALMNTSRWRNYDYPTSDDRDGVDARHPW
jgi:hypothetical protein